MVAIAPGVWMDDLRRERARRALDGLSVGEAFGMQLSAPEAAPLIDRRAFPSGRWRFGAATECGRAVLEGLETYGEVDQEGLARGLAVRMMDEPYRHWGQGTKRVLDAVRRGLAWQIVAPAVYEGGCRGSGMIGRSIVVGAWFSEDLDEAADQARAAAEVTHSHEEALDAAAAVACATAMAWRVRDDRSRWAGPRVLDAAVAASGGEMRLAMERAAAIRLDRSPAYAAQALGTGGSGSALDTVPFGIWCAARALDGFPGAIWNAVTHGGDLPMLAAVAGGVVSLAVQGGVPIGWLARRETLAIPVFSKSKIAQPKATAV